MDFCLNSNENFLYNIYFPKKTLKSFEKLEEVFIIFISTVAPLPLFSLLLIGFLRKKKGFIPQEESTSVENYLPTKVLVSTDVLIRGSDDDLLFFTKETFFT